LPHPRPRHAAPSGRPAVPAPAGCPNPGAVARKVLSRSARHGKIDRLDRDRQARPMASLA